MKPSGLIILTCIWVSFLTACTNISASPEIMSVPESSITLPTDSPQSENAQTFSPHTTYLQMTMGRAAHTATLLANGKVLLAGGFENAEQALASTEIFDPKTGAFLPANSMTISRQSHTATLLPNGQVLVAGGFNGDYLANAELYDPVAGTFTPTGSMLTARMGHVAVLLDSGKVLLVGGTGEGWTFLASAELYDPATGTFTKTGAMTTPRESHTATRLKSGEVLITGGHQGRRSKIVIYASAELYDPVNGVFMATGDMKVKRHKHDATLMADGRVLITGGADERDAQGAYESTEIFDPESGEFMLGGEMQAPRYKHAGTSFLLTNGQVLLAGGGHLIEIYDPQSGEFREVIESMGNPRFFAAATLLPNGEILFTGGYGPNILADSEAWVMDF